MTSVYVTAIVDNKAAGTQAEEFLSGGDSIFVAPTGAVINEDAQSDGTFAINFDSFGSAQIDGAVAGANGIRFDTGGGTSTVQVGAAGSIVTSATGSAAFGAVTVSSGAYRINNAGLIEANADALDLDWTNSTAVAGSGGGTVTNSGTIDSTTGNAIQDQDTSAGDDNHIFNTGIISAENGNAIAVLGAAAATIVNSGKIIASQVGSAIFDSSSAAALSNSGSIMGTVNLFGLGSSLFDSGAINGDVTLSGLAFSGATDVTIASGGVLTDNPGGDTLTVSGAYDIVNDGKISAAQSSTGGSTNAAVVVTGPGALENRGAIDSEFNGVVNNDSNAGDVAILDNYGSITGGASATAAQDTGGHTAIVNNYGEMSASLNAYFADSGTVVTLTNAGTMNGAVVLNAAGSSLTNSGAIRGDVTLNGAGANYDGVGGTVTGTIIDNGGGGSYVAGAGVENFSFGNGVASVRGGTGDDTFYFGGALTAATSVIGGSGRDTVELQGAYTGASALVLGAQTLRDIATLQLVSGFSYAITANAFTVSAGQTMIVDASTLAAANAVAFNASNALTGAYDLIGGAGADVFIFKAANLLALDTVDGGAGAAIDTLRFSTAGAIGAGALTNVSGIEHVVLANGTNAITLTDAMVASANGHSVTVFGGAGSDTINASLVTTATNHVTFVGGAGADTLIAGGGVESFQYSAASQSTGPTYDTIEKISFTNDRFVVPGAVGSIKAINAAVTTGALSTATFNANLAAAIGATQLGAHDAVLFTASSGTLAHDTFLIVDLNGTAGYQAGGDLVMRLIGQTGTLKTTDFI